MSKLSDCVLFNLSTTVSNTDYSHVHQTFTQYHSSDHYVSTAHIPKSLIFTTHNFPFSGKTTLYLFIFSFYSW